MSFRIYGRTGGEKWKVWHVFSQVAYIERRTFPGLFMHGKLRLGQLAMDWILGLQSGWRGMIWDYRDTWWTEAELQPTLMWEEKFSHLVVQFVPVYSQQQPHKCLHGICGARTMRQAGTGGVWEKNLRDYVKYPLKWPLSPSVSRSPGVKLMASAILVSLLATSSSPSLSPPPFFSSSSSPPPSETDRPRANIVRGEVWLN